ncbi:MAG: radical SAM protein, partial [Saprospiraceae bacterium]|nr:radical SAM protein [Saprospiraceae bacterium]
KEALFADLIRELDQVETVSRFGISSIEPNLCTDEIIAFVAQSERFVPHLHMPLQSGNNKQLREMRRRYTRELYASRVAKIREDIPHASIGVDVIVGFPGETEDDFLQTYHFLKELDISYLHVFTYSERPNTPASERTDHVDMGERKQRSRMLNILSDKKRRHFYQKFLGQTREVLFEEHKTKGLMSGYTDNYIRVELPYDPVLINARGWVELQEFNESGHIGATLARVCS